MLPHHPPGPSTPGPVPASHRSRAGLGPARPLAGFCCSLLQATLRGSEESGAAAGQGQPRAPGWGRCSSHPHPPAPNKCDVEGAACAGSIPSCHGDAGCILGQSIAGSCVGAPTFLPAAVTGGCVWGQGGGTSLLLGTAQIWTSPQHHPAASGCGVEPPDLIQRGPFGAGGSPGLPQHGHWQRDRSGMVAGGGAPSDPHPLIPVLPCVTLLPKPCSRLPAGGTAPCAGLRCPTPLPFPFHLCKAKITG